MPWVKCSKCGDIAFLLYGKGLVCGKCGFRTTNPEVVDQPEKGSSISDLKMKYYELCEEFSQEPFLFDRDDTEWSSVQAHWSMVNDFTTLLADLLTEFEPKDEEKK